MRLTFWSAALVFLLDQASKWIVVYGLDLRQLAVIEVFPPYLTFRMAWNRGINFGMLSGFDMRWILVGVAIVVSLIVLLWVVREGGGRWTYISAGLLVGGALGNAIDRVLYGAVADFINMSCCGIVNPYAFNLADVGVFAGAIGLVLFTGPDKAQPKTRRRKRS